MSGSLKGYVDVATHGSWDRMTAEEAVGTTHPVRCPECSEPGKVHKASSNGMKAHFEHNVANPACSLTDRRSK